MSKGEIYIRKISAEKQGYLLEFTKLLLVIKRLVVSSDTQRALPQRSRQQDLHDKDIRQ